MKHVCHPVVMRELRSSGCLYSLCVPYEMGSQGATWSILEFPIVSQQMVCERILRSCHHDYEDSCRNEILAPSGRKGPFGGHGQFQREQIDGTAAKLSIGFDRFWEKNHRKNE